MSSLTPEHGIVPLRFVVLMSDPIFSFRVQAHNTDKDQLIVKSIHPEALDVFATLVGQDVGTLKQVKGEAHFVTFVDRAKFTAAMAIYVTKITVPFSELKLLEAAAEAVAGPKDDPILQ